MEEQIQSQNEAVQPIQPASSPIEPAADLETLRNKKQQQFLAEALDSENALEANMGAIAADIFGMLRDLKKSLQVNLAEIDDPQLQHQELVSGFGMYLRGAKQTERFAHIQGRVSSRSGQTQAS
jgi:hypothetical protein